MSTTPSQAQLCQLYVQEQIHQLHTKEGDTGIVFGSKLDLLNEKLAYNCKKYNLELAFDNVHCLNYWLGTQTWIDTIFNEENVLNQHSLRLIEGAITDRITKDRDLELSDYRKLDDFAIFKLWNRLHPQNAKTFPRHTWLNNVGDLDNAGNPVVLDPPAVDRSSYLVPFTPIGFDVQDSDTWDPLDSINFERATVLYGFYPHHLRTRGFIFDEATRNASFPYRKYKTLTAASPTAEIIKAAKDLNVYNSAFEHIQRDRMEHSSRLKDEEAKKTTMKAVTDRVLGPTHQQAIAVYKQTCNFNAIRLYLEEKYGVLTDSTMVMDEIRKALTTPSTYAKCTNVASLVSTWEMLSSIFISLEHNHRRTPKARRPANINEIRASLYKDSLTYIADYPHTPRIISYADSRAYFLFPFELSQYASLVRQYKTEQLTKTIKNIKAVLERAEDADHRNPQRSLSSAAPTTFMASICSEPGYDNLWSLALNNRASSLSSSSLPSPSTPVPPHHPSSSVPTLPKEEAAWNLHALTVFSDNLVAIAYAKPCPVCKHIGKNRHPQERAFAEKHCLFNCPILPKIVHLPNPNIQGWPNNKQAGLPPYPSVLSRIRGGVPPPGTKRVHSRPSLSPASLQPRRPLPSPPRPTPLASASAPKGSPLLSRASSVIPN